jgi:radical SAM protein with 4Fe4S-binding SPASM domain
MLSLDIVHGCQLRCIGCPNSGLQPQIRFMPVDDFDLCLRNTDVAEIWHLRLFNFGEPLLHPDLPGILARIPGQQFHAHDVELSTNAHVANPFAMLAEALKTGVLGTLVVSCDGDGTPAEFERLRPPARWDRLMEFFRRTKELRDAYSPCTRLMTRTTCESERGRRRWLEILGPLGYVPEFRCWLNLPDARENPSGRALTAVEGPCKFLQKNRLFVDYDGTVVPCCAHPRAFTLGNLKTSRCTEILRGAPRRKLLHDLRSNRSSLPVCSRCEFRGRPDRTNRMLGLLLHRLGQK